MNEYKGRMQTKIELALEQSQQGVSNDILVTVSSSLRLLKPKLGYKGVSFEEAKLTQLEVSTGTLPFFDDEPPTTFRLFIFSSPQDFQEDPDHRLSLDYTYLGDCDWVCHYCGAHFWHVYNLQVHKFLAQQHGVLTKYLIMVLKRMSVIEVRNELTFLDLIVIQIKIVEKYSGSMIEIHTFNQIPPLVGLDLNKADKVSRDVLTVGSTLRIPLLFRGEYSQWSERFMNYLEEQTNGEAMINSIKNGDQPLPTYATMVRQNKNLLDINIDALYNILKQNQGDVNDTIGKKAIVITSNPLALVAEQTKKEDKKVDEKKRDMSKVKCYNCKKEGHFPKDYKKAKVLSNFEKSSSSSDDTIVESAYFDNDKQHRKRIADQEILFDKMSRHLVELDENVRMLKNTVFEKDLKISKLDECVPNKDLEIEKCLERLNECFENPSYFYKVKDLRPTLYDERVIGLGCTLRFLTHSDAALEIEKFKRARDNKIESAYDYGNLNASYVNAKINFLDDYFQEIINSDFKKIDSSFQQTSSLKPYVPIVILKKIIADLEDEVVSLLDKDKENLKIIESLTLKGCESSENAISKSVYQSKNDCQVVEKECDNSENSDVIAPGMFKLNVSHNLDTFSSVRRPKVSSFVWKKKGTSNISKVNFSFDNHSNLYKNVKQYSCKDLMSCNNSRLKDTRSAFICNNVRNASCKARMNTYDDVNDLFVFDDVCLRKSHVSKMPFRKKPRASLNMYFRSKLNKSLPRLVSKWLPKVQPLIEPIAKWIPRVKHCPDLSWIINFGCLKNMTGNRDLLTNFMEMFLGTVRFGTNDFAVIDGYGNVIIGSMTIKKVYCVEGLGHNLFSITKLPTPNVETSNTEGEVFHEVSESFQEESSSSSINDDVQQSSEE
uniref:Integrase, catalytic region, zinc finger, CCHC-type, peptidase aspartic, catalytic n=1 Tax=Tanacetum cinerariifolium TaxID=118510 RepID=A0A6L2MTG2_TANCI|nr:integrase, catalytic region, zinc finger, CCHC-type, peptidase aspartic, catalytic [Tanacetum cinerariifolium]